MIRRPPRSTQSRSSAASDVYKRQAPDPTDIDPITKEIIGQYPGGVVWSMREEVQNLFSDTDTRKNATFIHIPADSYHPALLTKGRGVLISGIRYYTSDIILY